MSLVNIYNDKYISRKREKHNTKIKYQNVKLQIKIQKDKNIDHRGHRGINRGKKRKKTLRTQRIINKNSVISVVKKIGVESGGLCVFLFILIFNF